MIQNNIWELKLISRLELNEFQWNLKKKDNQEKILNLSEEIKKHWFNCPIAIWDNNWIVSILDGHQRKTALQLLADKGLTLQDDKIPCIYIKANTEEEAKQILLEYNTKYSQFDTVELQEWVSDCDMEFLEIDEWVKEDDIEILDDFSLPSWDKWEIETITFTLHKFQNEQLQKALSLSKNMWEYWDTWNENANWNALARIVELFITQNQ